MLLSLSSQITTTWSMWKSIEILRHQLQETVLCRDYSFVYPLSVGSFTLEFYFAPWLKLFIKRGVSGKCYLNCSAWVVPRNTFQKKPYHCFLYRVCTKLLWPLFPLLSSTAWNGRWIVGFWPAGIATLGHLLGHGLSCRRPQCPFHIWSSELF